MFIPSTWELPESIKQRLGKNTAGHQRAVIEEGHVLLIVHRPPEAGKGMRDALFFWRNPQGQWKSTAGGSGLGGLQDLLDQYAKREQYLEMLYEAAAAPAQFLDLLEQFAPTVRSSANLYSALQAAREGVKGDRELISLRDAAGDVAREIELLNINVRSALDVTIARQNEEQNRISAQSVKASMILNIIAGVFLPLTALTSVFGMNLPSGMEKDAHPAVFWGIVIVSLLIGVALSGWALSMSREREELTRRWTRGRRPASLTRSTPETTKPEPPKIQP